MLVTFSILLNYTHMESDKKCSFCCENRKCLKINLVCVARDINKDVVHMTVPSIPDKQSTNTSAFQTFSQNNKINKK